VPTALDGKVQWHIDCGKNLQFIFEHPEKPCLKSSTIWTAALRETQFDILVVQPFLGTSIDQDVAAISEWLKLQPNARLVLHTGWNRHAEFETAFHAPADHEKMVHSPTYFQRLTERLSTQFPGRSISSTSAIQILDSIEHDIQDRKSPFTELKELYRDDIHMDLQNGRFLMHNAMRQALGQPISERGFQLEEPQKEYLKSKLVVASELK
jgi:hypothetical protein